MSTLELEIRVKKLENEVDLLKHRVEETVWWKKIAGTFANDKAHEEAMNLGREYRSSQNGENGNDNS
jgi:hypothetical protein